MLQPPLAGPVKTRLEHSSANWTWRGNKPRISLEKGSLSLLYLTPDYSDSFNYSPKCLASSIHVREMYS